MGVTIEQDGSYEIARGKGHPKGCEQVVETCARLCTGEGAGENNRTVAKEALALEEWMKKGLARPTEASENHYSEL